MRKTKLILAAAAALSASPALAAGNTMVVTANVTNSCALNAPDVAVAMATIRAGGSQSGNIEIWCTNGYAVQVSASSANSFNMVDGANTIAYSLTSGGSAFTNVPFTGNSSASYSTLPFALGFAAQNPRAGNYSDTITFTVAP